jgi:hypothetical protein
MRYPEMIFGIQYKSFALDAVAEEYFDGRAPCVKNPGRASKTRGFHEGNKKAVPHHTERHFSA